MGLSDIFLGLLLACIAGHSCHLLLLKSFEAKPPRSWKNHKILRHLPMLSVCFSLAVVITSALTKPRVSSECLKDSNINADIGGVGVLLGLFLPSIVIVLVLISGHWKAEPSGAKELCMAHMANLLYLTVNLAKSSRTTSIRDTLVAYSSIDAISASVSMAVSDKDVLAARKLVYASYILQVPAFVVEFNTLRQLSRFSTDCLAELQHPTISSSKAMMWTYLAIRIFVAFSPAPTVLGLVQRLNEIEHAPRQSLQVKNARIWETLPATLFTNYLVFGSLALVQAASTFSITQATFSLSAEKLRTEWGQSAALIVAVVSISHVAFSNFQLFRLEAMNHCLAVCQVNRSMAVWASPQQTWKTILFWRYLRQRSPIGKLVLRPADELLVDTTQLGKIDLILTVEERKALWEELQSAFSMYDEFHIKDCLSRGAPIDLRSANEEYPIHMAARLGKLEVLEKIHPLSASIYTIADNVLLQRWETENSDEHASIWRAISRPNPLNIKGEAMRWRISDVDEIMEWRSKNTPLSDFYERLVSKNDDAQTPLQLAIGANHKDAIEWLLKRILGLPNKTKRPRGFLPPAAQVCMRESFQAVMMAEKIDILAMMCNMLSWRRATLLVAGQNLEFCHFALLFGKMKCADYFIAQTEAPYWDVSKSMESDTIVETLRCLPHSDGERWLKILFKDDPSSAKNPNLQRVGLSRGYVQPFIDAKCNILRLCKTAIEESDDKAANFMEFFPTEALHQLPVYALDYMLLNGGRIHKDVRARWRDAGGRDWSNFISLVKHPDPQQLEELLTAETLNGKAVLMANAVYRDKRALLCLVHGCDPWEQKTPDVDLPSLRLMLDHGASVLNKSPLAEIPLMQILTGGRGELSDHHVGSCKTLKSAVLDALLRAAADESAVRCSGQDKALHICCRALCANTERLCRVCALRSAQGLEILLQFGCDPTRTDRDGKRPGDILRKYTKVHTKSSMGSFAWAYAEMEQAVEIIERWESYYADQTKWNEEKPTAVFERLNSVRI